MIRAQEYVDAFREGMTASFSAVIDGLEQAPEDMSANEAGKRFRAVQPELEARLVAEMDQVAAGLDR